MKFESQPEHSGNSFLRKKFKDLPIFFPIDYKNSNAVGTVRAYKLHIGQRIFMTFKDQRGSKLGMLIRVLTKMAIIVNAGAYVWSWSPVNMKKADSCSSPVCDHDHALCPDAMICEPHLDVSMLNIQIMCMFVLFANFVIPSLFCWSVPARLAGVLDLSHEVQKEDTFDDDEEVTEIVMARKRSSSTARNVKQYFGIANGTSGLSTADIDKMERNFTEDPKYPVFKQVCRYTTTGKSLRAIVGNVPLLLVFLTVSKGDLTGNGLLVYIARMTTLVQLVDFISGKKSGQVTSRTLARAYPTMLFMIWCIFLLAVVVGAIVFLLERGEFTVTEDFPDGAFLRPTVTGRGKEESPFTSMALSLYWVVVTVTSVGYGEMVCTSAYGRLISVMLMILSIFVLALPIAVIGQILTEEMENYVERKAQKETRVAKQIGVDESNKDLLKKYSTTIERRKSQFNFDLSTELKAAADKRQAMMTKMKSANDLLHRGVSFEELKTPPILKRAVTLSLPETIEEDSGFKPPHKKTSTSKLFSSWGSGDEDDSGSADTPSEDPPNDNEEVSPQGVVREHDLHSNGVGITIKQEEIVLGESPTCTRPSSSPDTFSPKRKVQSKAEAKWNESKTEKMENDNVSPSSPGAMSSPSTKSNRKNPMLRPTTAKRMLSESSLVYQKKSQGRGTLARSHSSKIRDIDQELRILERNYMKQMQQCTELHNQIVSLMKEKNDSLHEALL